MLSGRAGLVRPPRGDDDATPDAASSSTAPRYRVAIGRPKGQPVRTCRTGERRAYRFAMTVADAHAIPESEPDCATYLAEADQAWDGGDADHAYDLYRSRFQSGFVTEARRATPPTGSR